MFRMLMHFYASSLHNHMQLR